ncbi:hypothetical protein BX667DRAFT_194410 [Coemansia mojavensis]|nr:hypothetical protein BX667DRAFT_194410 [Coemansia mojavensis]KAJ1740402.1 hypothetical protein LPJ68_003801 [Coemansia sp. RSA 1086]
MARNNYTDNSRGSAGGGSHAIAGADNGYSGLLTSSVLHVAPEIIHPETQMSEREQRLMAALSKAHSEIRELQVQVQSLLSINLRYAEELRQALTAEQPARKRRREDSDATAATNVASSTAVSAGAGHNMAVQSSAASSHLNNQQQARQPLYLRSRLRTPSYPQAIAQSLGVSSTQQIYQAMQQSSQFQRIVSGEHRTGNAAADAAAVAAAVIMTSDNTSNLLASQSSSANIQQLLVSSSTPTMPAATGIFDVVNAPAASVVSAPAALPVASEGTEAQPERGSELNTERHGRPNRQAASLGSLAEAATQSSSRLRASTAERLDVNELEMGDADAIPSIGKFSSPRMLYQYKERVQEYESKHGSQWRERMDSKRRQNWSRISAVYTRILQLRGPSTSDADLERALSAVEEEMAQSRVTLTKYSQVVRKQIASERRQTSQRNQQRQHSQATAQPEQFGSLGSAQ